jgi:hypothetical protein
MTLIVVTISPLFVSVRSRLTVNVDLAFALLRGYARDHNRKPTDVATDVVEGRLQVRRPGSR